VAIADVTARAKVDVRGRFPAAPTPPVDTILAWISGEWLLVLGPPADEDRLLAAMELEAGPDAMVTDVTHLYAAFALLGPDVPALLERTTSCDHSALAPGEAIGAPIVEIPSVIARRDLPIPVVELYVATESARYAWEELSRVVGALGGQPVGWQALRAEGWR
jgi:sarcosine oxidase gamma subunit